MTEENGRYYSLDAGVDLETIAEEFSVGSWKDIYFHQRNERYRFPIDAPLVSSNHRSMPAGRYWIPGSSSRLKRSFRAKSGKRYHFREEPLRVIPIIVIPGVMGSRLCSRSVTRESEHLVWDPDSKVELFFSFGLPSIGAVFQKLCAPSELFPAQIPGYKTPLPRQSRFFGWASVSGNYYGGVLQALKQDHSLRNGQKVITPVYAFGYDWRKSNLESGKKLHAMIAKVCTEEGCEQVILVTHSMGGLVARACCVREREKVLGVIHVLEPATGAPLMYRRFKQGLTGEEDKGLHYLFGKTPENFAMIAGSMKGPVELLPTSSYRSPQEYGNEPSRWLKLADGIGTVKAWLSARDTYDEYIDRTSELSVFPTTWRSEQKRFKAEIDRLEDSVRSARKLCETIGHYVHPHTHICTSSSVPTLLEVTISEHHEPPPMPIRYAESTVPVSASQHRVQSEYGPLPDKHSGQGDGTVPISSQEAHLRNDSLPKICERCSTAVSSSVATQCINNEIKHDEVFGSSQGKKIFNDINQIIWSILESSIRPKR